MKRRTFLKQAAVLSTLPFLTCQTRKRPNIILIMADDLGYECLGCNGSKRYQTPHLDQLAKTGLRFTHAYSQPLCTPSRVQIMTGQYNDRNYTEFGSLPPGEYTFGHMLQDAGYVTCVVGKWQLSGRIRGTGYSGEGTLPEDAGFDEHCLWQVDYKGSRYWDPSIRTNGELSKDISEKYGPDLFCEYAVDFISRHRKQPFFLYYPMVLTHDPFIPTPDSSVSMETYQSQQKDRQDSTFFGDMVAYMDTIVDRIVAKLDELGLREQTLFIFTGDNGTHPRVTSPTESGPVRGAKGETIRTGMHVPMIVNQPGTTPAGVNQDLIDFTDFFPTFAQAAGASLPTDYPGDGVSFLPRLRGEKGYPREWIYCYYQPKWGRWRDLKTRFVMNQRWKLYGDGRFYDIQNDPMETRALQDLSDDIRTVKQQFTEVLQQ